TARIPHHSLRWRIGEKEALEQFRAEITGTSSSLQMLLVTASVTLITMNERDMRDHFDDAKRANKSFNSSQNAVLYDIRNRIGDTNRAISAGNAVLGKVTDALRMDWLRQLGSELKGLVTRAIAMNVATYHAVLNIQKLLPSRLERGLIEEPFILEDPIGRIAPVHLQFVTSWDAFHAVLEIRFRDLQGLDKIEHKKYGLQDRATGREIEQSRSWQRAFLPGQRVEMNLIFRSDVSEDSATNNTTCPG
ncbi:hypothetical protein CC86DRAFT_423586, partial [Ophiobolus disseminans]